MTERKSVEINGGFDAGRTCDRPEALVAYLYGEAGEAEAADFERHAKACATCRDELSAFGQVRASIGEWRAEALGLNLAPSKAADAAPMIVPAAARDTPRSRSAVAAFREFFALAPLWLRAATTAALVALCALTVLAVAHSEFRLESSGLIVRTVPARERVVVRRETIEVAKQNDVPAESEQTLRRQVAELQTKLADAERRQAAPQTTPQQQIIAAAATTDQRNTTQRRTPTPAAIAAERGRAAQKQSRPQPANNRLPIVTANSGEEDLPRLSDLLGDTR